MKISKNFKLYAIVWVILLALFNAIVFITPSDYNGESKFTDTFWIGYSLVTVGFIGQFLCAYVGLKDENITKVFYNIPLLRVSVIGLVVSAIAGSIFMALPTVESWIAALICLIVLAFVAIATIKASVAGDAVSAIDNKIKLQTFFIKSLTVDAQNLLARANTAETKDAVNKVYEAIRYSDPMSNDNLNEIENKISYEFKAFEMAVKNGDVAIINNQADELLILINNRNNKCKALK
ncbi:MAG: hypothetical protein IKV25_01700 [Clostridia bacterium]|nr:hypothetical protein [Clostridia bacterium]